MRQRREKFLCYLFYLHYNREGERGRGREKEGEREGKRKEEEGSEGQREGEREKSREGRREEREAIKKVGTKVHVHRPYLIFRTEDSG